ncbi:hypothetical protein EC968_001838 [Mortierella alpina]|nr:hypothetical protein EC968_001838 [Mortierella alpina]
MALWNEGDDAAWNTHALEAFLNKKADRQTLSDQSRARGRHGYDSPLAGLEDSEPDEDPESQEWDRDQDGDIKMSSAPDIPENENYYHNAETAEDQFLDRDERTRFFNVVLPRMQALALRLPGLVKKPIPFLKEQEDSAVTLNQEQIACLLANAFFCTRKEPAQFDNGTESPKALDMTAPNAPLTVSRTDGESKNKNRAGNREKYAVGSGRNAKSNNKESFPRYPSINFSSLFYSADETAPCTSTNAAKLRCILHYFDRITSQMPQGAVTYHRQVLNTPITLRKDERLREDVFGYVHVRVERDSPLEDDSPLGALQLDFANKVIGGGVLDRGSVQEEIRFVICPELIISRLFIQRLQENEAVLIKGAERYSNYNGYARTFEWHSDYVDTTPRDQLGRRKTEICAIDALPFKSQDQRLEQFSEEYVLRELNKAVTGFRRSPLTASEWGRCKAEGPIATTPLIATGNWGCGAFGGHLQLKFLIQLLAASVCGGYSTDDVDDGIALGRDIIYYTYGLDDLAKEIEAFMSHLQGSPRTFEPSLLLECILQYPIRSSQGQIIGLPKKSLLDYISTAFGFQSGSTQASSLDASFNQSSISSFGDSFSEPNF